MFRYYLKLGVLSIRANPALSALMVAAIAIGIGACMTIVTIHHIMSGNPIPHKSEQLFYVQVDNWDPSEPYDDPNEPPVQLTYLDATALMDANKASSQVISYKTMRVIEPDTDDGSPFQIETRATTADFFSMFDVPFKYGSGWEKSADHAREHIVVLSDTLKRTVIRRRRFGWPNAANERRILSHCRRTQ